MRNTIYKKHTRWIPFNFPA